MKKASLFIMIILGLKGFCKIPPNPPTPPTANNVSVTTCDDDGNNDGIKANDLTKLKTQILGAQDPNQYDVNFYSDAALTKPVTNPASSTLYHTYAQVYDKNDPSIVSTTPADVYVTVIPKPEPNFKASSICINPKTGQITNAYIVSGYGGTYNDVNGNPQPLYFFQWKDSSGAAVSQQPNYSIDTPGNYTLEITTNSTPACTSGVYPFTVNESAPPAKVTYTTNGYFSDNQTITITAEPYIGDGSNFLYSLDGNPLQAVNVCTNVKPGPHEIRVYDANGCGYTTTPIEVQTVYNPKYFTPNGDGFNDRFLIKGLEGQKDLDVYIFDCHGKLITQLLGDSEGWDGTFNGQPLPASDYWFTVSYTEDGVKKEYKSHFSLIR